MLQSTAGTTGQSVPLNTWGRPQSERGRAQPGLPNSRGNVAVAKAESLRSNVRGFALWGLVCGKEMVSNQITQAVTKEINYNIWGSVDATSPLSQDPGFATYFI